MTREELLKSLKYWDETSKKRHARLLHVRQLLQAARKKRALRRKQLKALQGGELKRFLHYCLVHVNEHEVGYTNTGVHIDKWEAECGLHAQPYCALFLMYQYHKATGRKLNCSYAYTPNILYAARKGVDFTVVSDPKPGDWELFNFGSSAPVQHVATVNHVYSQHDVETCEGNTSPGTGGSQDNGGGVYLRRRHGYGHVAYVRPHWNS